MICLSAVNEETEALSSISLCHLKGQFSLLEMEKCGDRFNQRVANWKHLLTQKNIMWLSIIEGKSLWVEAQVQD